jgi:hypothetical protein
VILDSMESGRMKGGVDSRWFVTTGYYCWLELETPTSISNPHVDIELSQFVHLADHAYAYTPYIWGSLPLQLCVLCLPVCMFA